MSCEIKRFKKKCNDIPPELFKKTIKIVMEQKKYYTQHLVPKDDIESGAAVSILRGYANYDKKRLNEGDGNQIKTLEGFLIYCGIRGANRVLRSSWDSMKSYENSNKKKYKSRYYDHILNNNNHTLEDERDYGFWGSYTEKSNLEKEEEKQEILKDLKNCMDDMNIPELQMKILIDWTENIGTSNDGYSSLGKKYNMTNKQIDNMITRFKQKVKIYQGVLRGEIQYRKIGSGKFKGKPFKFA